MGGLDSLPDCQLGLLFFNNVIVVEAITVTGQAVHKLSAVGDSSSH